MSAEARSSTARNYNDTWEGNTDNERILLFDLSQDQEEETNLAEEMPEVVKEMRSRLDVHLKRAVKPIHVPNDMAGHPSYPFPDGYFSTGWCQPIMNPTSSKTAPAVNKEEL